MFRRIFIAIILIQTLQHANSQQLQATLSHYSTDDGLCSNIIQNIYQDDYGYIWLATWNGVSRFDGYHFYNYRTGNASGIRHLHNRIQSMVIDQSQNVWMRMYDERLFVLNRQTDMIFNAFRDTPDGDELRLDGPLLVTQTGEVLASVKEKGLFVMKLDKEGLQSHLVEANGLTVNSLAQGNHGYIWLGTNKGIHRMDMNILKLEKDAILPDEHITAMYSDSRNIYVATRSGAIYSTAYGQAPKLIRKSQGEPLYSIFVDSEGLIWTNDKRMGVICYNPKTGKEQLFTQHVPTPEHDGKTAICSEANGVVWIRMNHGGFGYYNRQKDKVEYFHNDPVNPWNLSNTVHASLAIQDGIVWESTRSRGLDKLELLKKNIIKEKLVENAKSNLENEIRAILYDRQQNRLLMGNKAGALYIFGEDGKATIITEDASGKSLGRIYGIAKGAKDSYWICSKGAGIFHMTHQGRNWQLKNYCHQEEQANSLGDDNTYQAVEDKAGNLWIATYGGGVNMMTRDGQGNPQFLTPGNGMSGYPDHGYTKVRSIELDQDGNVWAGTTDGVLIMSYRNKQMSIEKLKMPDKGEQMLMSNDIVCLKRDEKGVMWIGTNGGGLSHTVSKKEDGTWLFDTFDSQDGLPSEEIRSITFDSHGNVCFATEHAICTFDVGKKIFTVYSNLDGVDETSLSEGGAATSRNGEILFGTIDGYYIIDQKKLMASSGSLMKLQITDFLLDDELQSPRLGSRIDYYVPTSKHVEIPREASTFAFRFASLNFLLQHRVHYQYILEGYDDDWKSADKNRTANFTDVPAGTYTFKVKAFLLGSPDKYDIRTIEVVVIGSPLLSPTAFWIYGILMLLVLLALLYKYRSRIFTKSKKKHEDDDEDSDSYEIIDVDKIEES